ncbi:hypothetical protein HNY73_002075 [Argiope bruennichi]|uniref:Uncharacterized protein n=1 Tax=Argiope bruennichi TaxID=94029 RepID=A0A8T0FTR7_ARGBR|nr:hypothetical protein HNY73_002075 [Argiope bruennichi]
MMSAGKVDNTLDSTDVVNGPKCAGKIYSPRVNSHFETMPTDDIFNRESDDDIRTFVVQDTIEYVPSNNNEETISVIEKQE